VGEVRKLPRINKELFGVYKRLQGVVPLSGDALTNLQPEWKKWLNEYGVAISDEAIDIAVVVASGMAKRAIETIEELSVLQRNKPAIKALLDESMTDVAVLASMRREKPWEKKT
jgi:hypothetical protein